MVWPMGLTPFRNLRANVSLTTATRGAPVRSREEKSRPATMGVPNVENQSSDTALSVAWTMPADVGEREDGHGTVDRRCQRRHRGCRDAGQRADGLAGLFVQCNTP